MAKNPTWFVYQEQDPPLEGRARYLDYQRKYHAWRRANDRRYAEENAVRVRRWHQARRERKAAVAREYGAEL